MFDTRKTIQLAAQYILENRITTRNHLDVERAILRIALEVHEMCDEARQGLVAATVTACEGHN